jgi:NADH-quinone oxidoreductase subunit A
MQVLEKNPIPFQGFTFVPFFHKLHSSNWQFPHFFPARMVESYIPILLMLTAAVLFGVIAVKVNEWLGPKRPTAEKLTTYESGMEPVRSARERFSVKFYMVAVLFILFDIEIVFMYPWAVSFSELGPIGFFSMLTFIAILLVGYFYVWRKGALEWD